MALSLGGNQLTGEIPPELGSLSNLEYLALLGYTVNREDSAGTWQPLQTWNGSYTLMGTILTGEIPPELGNLSNLGTSVARKTS